MLFDGSVVDIILNNGEEPLFEQQGDAARPSDVMFARLWCGECTSFKHELIDLADTDLTIRAL